MTKSSSVKIRQSILKKVTQFKSLIDIQEKDILIIQEKDKILPNVKEEKIIVVYEIKDKKLLYKIFNKYENYIIFFYQSYLVNINKNSYPSLYFYDCILENISFQNSVLHFGSKNKVLSSITAENIIISNYDDIIKNYIETDNNLKIMLNSYENKSRLFLYKLNLKNNTLHICHNYDIYIDIIESKLEILKIDTIYNNSKTILGIKNSNFPKLEGQFNIQVTKFINSNKQLISYNKSVQINENIKNLEFDPKSVYQNNIKEKESKIAKEKSILEKIKLTINLYKYKNITGWIILIILMVLSIFDYYTKSIGIISLITKIL